MESPYYRLNQAAHKVLRLKGEMPSNWTRGCATTFLTMRVLDHRPKQLYLLQVRPYPRRVEFKLVQPSPFQPPAAGPSVTCDVQPCSSPPSSGYRDPRRRSAGSRRR